ncbi:MAG: 4'-phosphopantetheinyl transferase superfamily protein [Firmicutes bacterium]|nr:4'-phosphopantetheinyl transferase superfamily protein [Bacillota bacterium]
MSGIKDRIYIMRADEFDDENKFNATFSRLSDYRREKISRLKHREDKTLSLAAGYLIDLGLGEYGLCERGMKYAFGKNNKPYFAEYRDIFFNVSHSGSFAVCAFSDFEVGCDIETSEKYNERFLKRFFSKNEREAVMNADDRAGEFIRFWTRKESFLKASGDGITRTLADLDTTADTIEENGAVYRFTEYKILDRAPICVCKKDGCFDGGAVIAAL